MPGFFRRKPQTEPAALRDWSFLGTDMHAHFMPGIDDGPSSLEQSLDLLRYMQDSGYSAIITTPHISLDYFPDTEPLIATGLVKLQQAVADNGLHLKVSAAAEYMIDEAFMKKLKERQQLLTFGGRYVLIEMGFIQVSPLLQQAVFELQSAGYQPVLAHPERYHYYQDIPVAELQRLKASGCMFQLNTIALSGYYGKHVKVLAEKLLKERLYEFAGSDIHHSRHVKALDSILSSDIFPTLTKYHFLNNII